MDWNIRGEGGHGLERQGLQNEEDAAAARNGKENKHKSKEGGERGQEEKESGGGWRGRRRRSGQAPETRTGTSGDDMRTDCNIRGRSGPGLERPALHTEKEAVAARRTCTRARDGGEGEHEEQE